jgi:hypothetical protein
MNDPFSRGRVAAFPAEMLAFATASVGGADEVTVRHARGHGIVPAIRAAGIAEDHVTIGASLVAFLNELQDTLETTVRTRLGCGRA